MGRSWIKSTFSGSGDCVEVSYSGPGDAVLMRDSKDPQGPHLRFSRSAWDGLLSAMREGICVGLS
ncbi:MAG: DUF397 domain-containing protein [Actinomycetales bacterium]|nr:DUF397 domain-containing protein [Actinomycetales bacterium]